VFFKLGSKVLLVFVSAVGSKHSLAIDSSICLICRSAGGSSSWYMFNELSTDAIFKSLKLQLNWLKVKERTRQASCLLQYFISTLQRSWPSLPRNN
jgi:hypothetical protein